nr:cyclase family protein [bacterium]
FTEDYVALSGEAAEWLAGRGTRVVGIDYLSIQKRGADRTPHTALLERGAVIIEGLYLGCVPAGEYELIALPLRITGGDGAPARVLLKA